MWSPAHLATSLPSNLKSSHCAWYDRYPQTSGSVPPPPGLIPSSRVRRFLCVVSRLRGARCPGAAPPLETNLVLFFYVHLTPPPFDLVVPATTPEVVSRKPSVPSSLVTAAQLSYNATFPPPPLLSLRLPQPYLGTPRPRPLADAWYAALPPASGGGLATATPLRVHVPSAWYSPARLPRSRAPAPLSR